jgi:hypothetical protein
MGASIVRHVLVTAAVSVISLSQAVPCTADDRQCSSQTLEAVSCLQYRFLTDRECGVLE